MARKRMIDPEFWADDEIGNWDYFTRLFYIGLWTAADDEGYFEARASKLKGEIFRYDSTTVEMIEQAKKTVVGANTQKPKVVYFEVDGKEYGHLQNFQAYQKPQHPTPSKIKPLIHENSRNFMSPHETSPQSRSDQSMLNQSSLGQISIGQSSVDLSTTPFKPEDLKTLKTTIEKHTGAPKDGDRSRALLVEVLERTREAAKKTKIKDPLAYAIKSIQNLGEGK